MKLSRMEYSHGSSKSGDGNSFMLAFEIYGEWSIPTGAIRVAMGIVSCLLFEFVLNGIFPWEAIRVAIGIVSCLFFEFVLKGVFPREAIRATVGIKVV